MSNLQQIERQAKKEQQKRKAAVSRRKSIFVDITKRKAALDAYEELRRKKESEND